MPKPEIYGYEELIRMSRDELITIYNRNVERVNRQVSRTKKVAPGLKSPELERLPKFRKKDAVKTDREIVADIVGAQSRKGLTKANAKTMADISTLVGQSYYGKEHDDAYKSNWVSKLTPEQLQLFRDRIGKMGLEMDDYELWYLLRKMGYVGDQMTPIRSFDDLMELLDVAEDYTTSGIEYQNAQAEFYAQQEAWNNNLISDDDMEDYWVNHIMDGDLL